MSTEEKEIESVEVVEVKDVNENEIESPTDDEKKDDKEGSEEGDAIDAIETEMSKEAKLISTEEEKYQTDQTSEGITNDQTNEEKDQTDQTSEGITNDQTNEEKDQTDQTNEGITNDQTNEEKDQTDQTNEETSTGRKKDGKIIERGIKGVVKWYNVTCAYGFISRDDKEQDLFVHRSGISLTKSSNFVRSLEDGERVEFDVVDNSKGSEAINVTGPDGGPVKGSKFARAPRPFYARQFTGRPANGTGYRGGRPRFDNQNQGYDDYEGGPLRRRRFPRTFDGYNQYDGANTMPSRGRFGDRRNNNNRMSYGGEGRGGFHNNRSAGYGSGYRDGNTYNNRSVGYGRGYGSGSYNNRNIGYGNRRGSAPRSYMRGRERSWVGSERRRRYRNEDEGAEDGENVVEKKENVEPERRARQKQRQSRHTRHERRTTRRRKETSESKSEEIKDDETKEIGEEKEEEESKIESNVEVVSTVEIKSEKKGESKVDIVVDTLAIKNGGAGDGPNQQIDIKDEKPGPADVVAEE